MNSLLPVMMCALIKLWPTVRHHTFKLCTDRTPSMHRKSLVRRSVLMPFGTDSKIIPIESFIMVHVVIITMMENTNVHIGSAIFAFGCKIEIIKIIKIWLRTCINFWGHNSHHLRNTWWWQPTQKRQCSEWNRPVRVSQPLVYLYSSRRNHGYGHGGVRNRLYVNGDEAPHCRWTLAYFPNYHDAHSCAGDKWTSHRKCSRATLGSVSICHRLKLNWCFRVDFRRPILNPFWCHWPCSHDYCDATYRHSLERFDWTNWLSNDLANDTSKRYCFDWCVSMVAAVCCRHSSIHFWYDWPSLVR